MKKTIRRTANAARTFIIPLVIWICINTSFLFAQTTRYVKPVASGTGDGSSWANASADLQSMINNSGNGDSVFVAAGTYQRGNTESFSMKEGVKIYGGFAGTETQLSQRNWVTNVTILLGNNAAVIYHYYNYLTAAALLDGFTVKGGNFSNGAGMSNMYSSPSVVNCIFSNNTGSAMFNFGSSPVVINCTFSNNTAAGAAGMYNYKCSPTITNCSFISNTTSAGGGGGGGGAAIANAGASPVITNCYFSGNTTPAAYGGAIYSDRVLDIYPTTVYTPSNVSATDCVFENNSALGGGAIYSNIQSTVTLTRCRFLNNHATGGDAGALVNNEVIANITRCDFIGNTASANAGVMTNYGNPPVISYCTFSGNTAQYTAVIDNRGSNAILQNCLFTGNKAQNAGACITNENSSAPTITNCTFSGNNDGFNAGVIYNYQGGAPVINNCIIWGNSVGIYSEPSAGTPTVQYSVIQGGYAGIGNLNADPLFKNAPVYTSAPFTNGDFRLKACSPAINAGNTALVPAGISMDLDSNARIVGSAVDMGAYEYAIIPTGNILYVNKNIATNKGTGESWAKALPELAEALRYAKVNQASWTPADPLKIFVAKGTYKPAYQADNSCVSNRSSTFPLAANVQVYGGFDPANGIDDLNDPRIFGASGSILSGDIGTLNVSTDNCYHVVTSSGAVGTARLDGFTIKDGYGDYVSGDTYYGAGMLNITSSPSIANCTFSNNYSHFGSALYNTGSAPVVTNSTFSGNTADSYGGAVYNNGVAPTYTNCTFSGNSTINGTGGGGAIFNNGSAAVVTNCTFSSNTGDYGGGIYNYGASTPNITGCTFNLNSTGNFGGAIYSQNTASPVITGCTFTGNHTAYGGATLNEGMATFLNCSFANNYAVNYGGAVYNSNTFSPVYTNCIFSGNYTTNGSGGGGGVFNNNSTANIVNCTFRGNTAAFGAAIRNWGTSAATVRNSIIWGNNTAIYNESGASASVQYSDVQGGYTGTGNMNVDPLFVNTASPEGPDGIWGTLDDGLRLQPCSPAVNVGNNGSVTAGVTTDIGGTPRIQFITADMGAYEANSLANMTAANLVSSNTTTSGWQLANGQTFYATNCTTIEAAVTGDGTASSITGNTTVKVWIESSQPSNFVKRHYEIMPDNNAGTATATITLFFTQAEFDAFNAINTTKLPQNPTDVAGKANLRIEKRSGVSSNGSGLPNTYSGSILTIDPNDANIVWNATRSRWEVSYAVTGFSGFFVKTNVFTLPLKLTSFTAEENNCTTTLRWTTKDESTVSHFEVEESADGISFRTIKTVAAKNTGVESNYTTNAAVMNSRAYYRLKMVDADGRITYSSVAVVNSSCANLVFVYPSPAKEKLFLRNATIGTNYDIYDNTGKKVVSGRINNIIQEVSIGNIVPGVYYIRVAGDKGSGNLRFVKE